MATLLFVATTRNSTSENLQLRYRVGSSSLCCYFSAIEKSIGWKVVLSIVPYSLPGAHLTI
jgi:hypothetical protein